MTSTAVTDPFHSERLSYRAIEVDEDEALFVAIQQDAIAFQQSNFRLAVAQRRDDARRVMKQAAEDNLLGVTICLKSTAQGEGSASSGRGKEEAIGYLTLEKLPSFGVQHRHTSMSVDIVSTHQGKGYGKEAIIWATAWAFDMAGLHRVQLRCFEYNARAVQLYKKLGFREEGRWREFLWWNGRFWDDIQFSMLEHEWRERHQKK